MSTIILIADLVEANPLPAAPNMTLRARLMAAYQLTNIKRWSCSSTNLCWAENRSYRSCWRRCFEVRTTMTCLTTCWLNKLPRELQVLLTEADM